MEDLCLKILEQRGIKFIVIWMLVLKVMMEMEQVVLFFDLENKLDIVDKLIIFCMIILFVFYYLVYSVDDGIGFLKYVVCDSECICVVKDLYIYFYCEYCYKIFCFENIYVFVVDLFEGFVV